MSRITTFIFTLALLLSTSGYSFAQEASTSTAPASTPSATNSASTFHGPLNCNDYYKLGSVKAQMQANVEETLPGVTILFAGSVTNDNPSPLTGGVLVAKVYKEESDIREFSGAHEVVDQFVIKEDIVLPAKATLPVEHEWQVPINAEGGKYFVAYYFLDAKRYQLLGASYADDSVGGVAPFSVGSDYKVAKFARSKTTLNGAAYSFAAAPLPVKSDEPIVVSVTIQNASDQSKTMPLQWNQFAWDNTSEKNHRGTKTEVIKLEPGETKTFTYTAVEQAEPLVQISAVTQDIETKSLVTVRALKEGVSGAYFSFASITAFPLTVDEPQTIAACISGYGPNTAGNTLRLTLTDKDGAVVHEYKYEGEVFGTLSGFGEKFVPTKKYSYLKLTATLERDGQVIDEVIKEYNCESIDPTGCEATSEGVTNALTNWFSKTTIMIGAGVLLLVLLATLGVLVARRRNKKNSNGRIIDGMEMELPESN